MEENLRLLEQFRDDPNVNSIFIQGPTKEGRREIRWWALANKFKYRSEYLSYKDGVKAVRCEHCGHMEDYNNPECDSHCDFYSNWFTCSKCFETTSWDSEDHEPGEIVWNRITKPTGFVIVMKGHVDNYKKNTPTPGGTWKRPY